MKKEIHPKFYEQATVTCACGNSFVVGSTQEKIEVEVCSDCHPFFTGKEKVMDTAGRVEKFLARQKQAVTKSAMKKKKTAPTESGTLAGTETAKTEKPSGQ